MVMISPNCIHPDGSVVRHVAVLAKTKGIPTNSAVHRLMTFASVIN